jgi:hypothetical protein
VQLAALGNPKNDRQRTVSERGKADLNRAGHSPTRLASTDS